ncbi:carbamate kinase [Flexilinea flocculi]|jgi:carbamate kinase|uniref:Carbamate kinase n=1 Tax=Flexilinea flocculi TaxID=1678840 RepID=A0A0K8PB17_9CHLR|nr:carbamate kinase [Flexilinea flocculi]GAP39857.1 carbamate kinase [Flexilinea flocculi]
MAKKVAVVAIGGNSLIKDKAHQSCEDQYLAAKETAKHIVDMIEAGWEVVVGHGNGPQVGFILQKAELAEKEVNLAMASLDVCGAQSQGQIGYMLAQNLQNELKRRKIEKSVACVLEQTIVDKDDPAFKKPTKPIGGFMGESEAKAKAEAEGWTVVEDAGRGWRRVVASPLPKEIVELEAIRSLIEAGVVTISIGGGGIPVIRDDNGDLEGVAAVIDKDFGNSLLAREIKADLLLISTAVEKVAINYGTAEEKWLDRMTLAEAKAYLAEGKHFKSGSMAPKIQACIWFLEAGGKQALITNPENIGRALKGESGTLITCN